MVGKSLQDTIASLEKSMQSAAANLEFEEAARLRDEIRRLEAAELEIASVLPSLSAASKNNSEKAKNNANFPPIFIQFFL